MSMLASLAALVCREGKNSITVGSAFRAAKGTRSDSRHCRRRRRGVSISVISTIAVLLSVVPRHLSTQCASNTIGALGPCARADDRLTGQATITALLSRPCRQRVPHAGQIASFISHHRTQIVCNVSAHRTPNATPAAFPAYHTMRFCRRSSRCVVHLPGVSIN